MIISYSIILAIAALASFAITPLVRHLAITVGAVDNPGVRKVHQTPVPRLGGVAVAVSILVTLWIATSIDVVALSMNRWGAVLAGGIIVFLIGVWDDARPLNPVPKLIAQATAALLVTWYGIRIETVAAFGSNTWDLGILAVPISVLWIVGLTNAFNFIDGLDGLAAGLAIIAAGTSAAIFAVRSSPQEAAIMVILLGALFGFLPYNFNPAKIFLGDSGSMLVGFILSVTAISGSQKRSAALAVMIPVLLFGVPIADTILAMLRRFINGVRGSAHESLALHHRLMAAASMMQADKGHIHHKLLELGLSHVKVVLIMYGCGVVLAGAALLSVVARYELQGYILITVGLATYIGLRKLGYHELFASAKDRFPGQGSPSFNRVFFIGFVDLTIICITYWAAVLIKYDIIWGPNVRTYFAEAFPRIIPVQLGVLLVSGLYRGLWRATGLGDLWRIACASMMAIVLSCAGTIWWMGYFPGLITFFAIDLSLLFLSIAACRTAPKFYQSRRLKAADKKELKAVIYGAGRGGQLALWELTNNQKYRLRPVAFIDDNPALMGRTVNLIPIVGTIENLEAFVSLQGISTVVISSQKITQKKLSEIAEVCKRNNVAIWNARLRFEPLPLGEKGDVSPETVTEPRDEANWLKKQKVQTMVLGTASKSRP